MPCLLGVSGGGVILSWIWSCGLEISVGKADLCWQDTEQQLSLRYQDGGGFTQGRLCGEHWNGVNGTNLVEIDWQT